MPPKKKQPVPASPLTTRACLPGRREQGKQPRQPVPEALTKSGEVKGQVAVGAPAPEGDAVQGALHGSPLWTGWGAPATRGGCVAASNRGSRLAAPAPESPSGSQQEPGCSARCWNGRARQALIGPRWFEWEAFHLTEQTLASAEGAWTLGAAGTATRRQRWLLTPEACKRQWPSLDPWFPRRASRLQVPASRETCSPVCPLGRAWPAHPAPQAAIS